MSREISFENENIWLPTEGSLGFSLDHIEMTNSEILRGLQIIWLSPSCYCTILYSNTQREENNKCCIKITSNTLIPVYCVVFLVKTSLINHILYWMHSNKCKFVNSGFFSYFKPEVKKNVFDPLRQTNGSNLWKVSEPRLFVYILSSKVSFKWSLVKIIASDKLSAWSNIANLSEFQGV